MSPKLLRGVSFFAFLRLLDLDLAARTWESGCPLCGGPLHTSRYPRKLRGVSPGLAVRFQKRESFCCGARDCRRRATPPSVVFMGRRLYAGAMVVLVSALAHGASERRLDRLRGLYGLDRHTLLRWQSWWQETFPATDFFRAERGRFSPPLGGPGIVRELLSRFSGAARDRLISVLLFLVPLTTASVAWEGARRWAGETRRGGGVNAP